MGYLKNTVVNYISRSAEQIFDSVLSLMGVRIPEITDLSLSNPFISDVLIFSGISEQLGYYINNISSESFIDSARLYSSLVSLAKVHDYRIIAYRPYTADVVFTLSGTSVSNVTIPAGFKLATASGIPYVTQATATIVAGQLSSNAVGVSQYEDRTAQSLGNSTGQPNQEIALLDQIVDGSISLRVSGVTWKPVSTLAYSSNTDTDFVQSVNENGEVVVYFGNANPIGAIPSTNAPIQADYKITLGADGYAAAGEINTLVSTPTLPGGLTVTVTNPTPAVGGADVETLEELKDHISIANRTLGRAVTDKDYADIAKLAPGVANAAATYNRNKIVQVYIVPIGGGIASSTLRNTVQNFFADKRLITTKPEVYSAGEVHIKIVANIIANPSYTNAAVEANAKAAITNWLSYLNQTVGGKIVIGDIYQRIEEADGVENSDIVSFYAEPYARPTTTTTPVLNWTTAINGNSIATSVWKIQFISTTQFWLIKNNVYVGLFSTGGAVIQPEITFTIAAGGHTIGDSYEFVTYPYASNVINLAEPSLPVAYNADLTFNVTGGL